MRTMNKETINKQSEKEKEYMIQDDTNIGNKSHKLNTQKKSHMINQEKITNVL
jgi:hypothetical protein